MRRAAVVLISLALAAPAAAAPTQGRYFLPNHGGTKMRAKRAERFTGRVVRKVYAVKPGTGIYACDRTERNKAACEFAFLTKAGVYTCGYARVSANEARIAVRYSADTGHCPAST